MIEGLLETPQTIVSSFLKRAKLAKIGVYLAFAERTKTGASFSLVTNVDEPEAADGMRIFMLGLTRPETITACAKALYDHAVEQMKVVAAKEGYKMGPTPTWDEMPPELQASHIGAVNMIFETLKDQSAARLPAQTIVG